MTSSPESSPTSKSSPYLLSPASSANSLDLFQDIEEISFIDVDQVTEPNLDENSTKPWKSFKITRSILEANTSEYDFQLLKDNKTSILGDVCLSIGNDNYTLDRCMLASKSRRFEHLILSESEEKISTYVKYRYCSFQLIVDIIYGKGVRSAMNEDNFAHLLLDMFEMKLETDLEIFKTFMELIINPKPKLNDEMFFLLNLLLDYDTFDYLLSTVSGYFSNRLLDFYKKKEFLELEEDQFVCILLHKSDNVLEKHSIGLICGEWICYAYQRRIESVITLVNASKYRYGIFPYCDWDPNLEPEHLKLSDGPDVRRVEIYFNELVFSYLGEASFELPPALIQKLTKTKIKSGDRILFPNDQIRKWTSYLEKGIFCDVTIIIQETTFKLHRIMLSSVSGYFHELFTNPNASLESEIDNSAGEPKISKHELNQIDTATFKSIIGYIYKQEIEVTSASHLIKLLEGSKFLKMNDLFEKCFSKLLEIARNPSTNILELFQYVFKNEYSEVYNAMIEKLIVLWPKLDKNPEFVNISLDVLKELLALPDLKIDNTDEIADLCSKWIFHDIQIRYKFTVEIAKAINRNFLMNSKHIKLEIPLNSTDFSQEYIKQQLIKILTSSALVSLSSNNISDEEKNPAFVIYDKVNYLCVVDGNFNVMNKLARITEANCQFSATSNDDELFILYCVGAKFYFQLYRISTKRMILLASDFRMDPERKFVILICRNEIYFCNDEIILKYSIEFNRWVTFEIEGKCEGNRGGNFVKLYTSDRQKLYKICPAGGNEYDYNSKITVSYYDFGSKNWILLPSIPVKTMPIKASIIKSELSLLFESSTYSFSWMSQKWSLMSYSQRNFVEFKDHGQNIMFISKNNEVHLYSPATRKWTKERNLDVKQNVVAIHTIFK